MLRGYTTAVSAALWSNPAATFTTLSPTTWAIVLDTRNRLG